MKLTSQQLKDMGYVQLATGDFARVGPSKWGAFSAELSLPSTILKGSPKPPKRIPKTPEERLNRTEREFLGRLRADVYGKMQHIGIQSITLQLGFDCRYTPDFWTRMEMGDFRFWEVKGFMREDARVKLFTAARVFPFWTFLLVEKEDGQWKETIVRQ